MKLALIALSGMRVQNPDLYALGLTLPGFIERKEVIASLPSLSLLTLAALTPSSFDIEYIELPEFSEGSPLPGEFDAVAISSFTAQIHDAYRLAGAFRLVGTKVILGGLHVTALPYEAARHADSVVLGEAEPVWPQLLKELLDNKLKSVYDARQLDYCFSNATVPRYDLLDIEKYNRLTVQTQRGCPFKCEFCASSIQLTNKYKIKPIERVAAEIDAIKQLWSNPFIELADDNTFSNKPHSRRLVAELARQGIKWFTETDISVSYDDRLLDMLADSGCRQLLIGFESPSWSGLNELELKASWKARQRDHYLSAIDKIQSRGISVNGCFVLGLDSDREDCFDRVYDFSLESGLSEVQITLQTPFPGTPLYDRLKREDRLLRSEFWEQCTLFDVTYMPRHMTVQELEQGFKGLMKRLYDEELVQHRKRRFINGAREHKQKRLIATKSAEL